MQERALALFQEMGMRIRYMDPKSHDKHIVCVAFVSHQCFMLGKQSLEKHEQDIFDMAGSGLKVPCVLLKVRPRCGHHFKQNRKS
jgi:prephenate dehydrogenase